MRKKFTAVFAALLLILTCLAGVACGNQPKKPEELPEAPKSANEFTDDRMMMGMYHLTPALDHVKNQIGFQDAIEGDVYNVFLMSRVEIPDVKQFDEWCTKIYEAGKRFFLFDSTALWNFSSGFTTYKDIYVRMHDLKEFMRSKPYYDAFLGYYVDEPLLLGVPLTELYEASKAFRTTFPDKRFMVVFSAGGISTEYDIGAGKDRLTREGGEYITDIGYDIYGAFGDYWVDIWDTMTEMFAGQNKNYWAVPMVMNYRGICTEDDALSSLEGCWEYVKSTNGGVGMMCYNAYTYPADVENIGNIGFCDMANTSLEDFMGWKDKKDPWKSYYAKFYNEDGSQKTAGVDFVPWTRLKDKLAEIAAEIETLNENKLVKAETEMICKNDQSFTFDSAPHTPQLEEFVPGVTYAYKTAVGGEWSESAPVAKGSYLLKLTVKESVYRKAAERIVSFTIGESADTMIASELITEDYSSAKKTVKFDVEGYEISLNGIDYAPYERNAEVDITDMISYGGRAKYVWLKEGEKAPFGYQVKRYDRIAIQSFEKGTNPTYSDYVVSGLLKKEGSFSGQLKFKYNATEGKHTSEFNTLDLQLAPNGQNLYSIAGSTAVEFWVYSDKEVSFGLWLIADNWAGSTSSETFTVPKNSWTKLSFDTAKFVNGSTTPEYAMSHLLLFTFVVGGDPQNVFIDSLCAVGLK